MASLASMPSQSRTTNLAQPVQPRPRVAPNLPPSPGMPPLQFQPTTVGAAPTSTPMGAFQAPDASSLANDPGVQFRLEQANKGAQRSAAARGSLLSGGFQTALAKLNQGLASQEYGNLYDRALSTYGANRDTNQQNFGQSLAGYQAGTGAQLDAGRLNLAGTTAGYDRTYGARRDAYGDARDAAMQQADVTNANASASDTYARQMEDYRAAIDAQRGAPSMPSSGSRGGGFAGVPPYRPGNLAAWERSGPRPWYTPAPTFR